MDTVERHRIQITIPDGYPKNAEILLDGKPLHGVVELTVDAESAGDRIATITFKMIADVSMDIETDTYRIYTVDRNSGEFINAESKA